MKTYDDILYIMREIYRLLWCHDNDITCKNCKYADACNIYADAISEFRKSGEYH